LGQPTESHAIETVRSATLTVDRPGGQLVAESDGSTGRPSKTTLKAARIRLALTNLYYDR
jgi:hypothetical protein